MIPSNRTVRPPPIPSRIPGASTRRPVFLPITAADKAKLDKLMKERFKWPYDPRPMQIRAGIAQVDGDDVLVHAPTGLGKTGIVAAPYAFPQNAGRVTIFVSPLIALQEEMVTTFQDDYKLPAVAVNSTRTKNLKSTMRDICSGKYAVVLISPEMLQSRRFVDGVLRDGEFYRRVLSLVVDEAHTVSHWGAQFRKKYGSLGIIRAFLPPGTSVVAMSASLTPRVRRDVLKKLQFGDDFVNIDEGNNRPNVAIVVRPCHRLLGSFADLDFVIPTGVQSGNDIPSTFIYCDKKEEGDSIIDHLRDLLPENLRDLGLIRPFNATMSHRYRRNALQHFKAGNIRIMVCTDAAGMGCNIPNIEVVVQWKLPEKLSMFVQRAGRAARRAGASGLAVLLVEPTAYTEFIDRAWKPVTPTQPSTSAQAKKPSRTPRGYGKAHGRNRGCEKNADFSKRDETIILQIDEEAEDEGLICLVQTGDCRRRVIADAFANRVDRSHTGPCCDLCDPSLLARTLPGKGPPRKRGKKKDKTPPADDIVNALYDWRMTTWKRDLKHCGFSDVAILSDDRIEELACVPEFDTERKLREQMSDWRWWSRYGHSLWRALSRVYNDRAAVPDPAPTNVTTRGRAVAATPATDTQPDVVPQSTAEPTHPVAPSAAGPTVPSAPPNGSTVPQQSASAGASARKRTAPSDEPEPAIAAHGSTRPAASASSSSIGPSAVVSQPVVVAAASGGGRTKRARTGNAPFPARPPGPPPPSAGPPPPPTNLPYPPPEHLVLSPGSTVPDILRHVVPFPAPSGPFDDPSRLVRGPDARLYFAAVDGKWFRMPVQYRDPHGAPPTGRGGRGSGRGAGRGRGRGRGTAP